MDSVRRSSLINNRPRGHPVLFPCEAQGRLRSWRT